MKKRIISSLLCTLMLLSLCACAPDNVVQPRTVEPQGSEGSEMVSADSGFASISLALPDTWTWRSVSDENGFGIELGPKDCPQLKYTLEYCKRSFGVCGTGLTMKELIFGDSGLKGSAGYYDGEENWLFISFADTAGSYAVTRAVAGGESVDSAKISDYNRQLESILCTASLGVGAVTEEQALSALKGNGYDEFGCGRFDYATGWWVFTSDKAGERVYTDSKCNIVVPDFLVSEGSYKNAGTQLPYIVLSRDGSFAFGAYNGSYELFGDIVRLCDNNTRSELYFELSDRGLKYLAEYSGTYPDALLADGMIFDKC